MREQAPPAAEHGGPPAALELEGLWRLYGERAALRDVTFALAGGRTLAVLGPNGAGKTTLLRVLATLLRPSAGRAVVLACNLPGQGWKLRGRVGYLGHEPLLYRDLTCVENLRFHARLHGVRDAESRISELLAGVRLERRGDELVRNLSAGMVQRLAVCRAVLHGPELLLLDEPRSHLDPDAREVVEPLLGIGAGRTRVVVSHEPAAALAEADRALLLRGDGSVAYEGPAGGLSAGDARAVYGGLA